jgi:hypothetical protein
MRCLTFSLVFIFLFGCTEKESKKDEIFFIIKHPGFNTQSVLDSARIKDPTVPPPPPPPPILFYGYHNFILEEDGRVFYHTKNKGDLNVEYRKEIGSFSPPFINLLPGDFTEIQSDSLLQFLESTFTKSPENTNRYFSSISSPVDTIRNAALLTITDYFKYVKLNRYVLRNTTAEENYALDAKRNNTVHTTDSAKFYATNDSSDVTGIYRPIEKKPVEKVIKSWWELW